MVRCVDPSDHLLCPLVRRAQSRQAWLAHWVAVVMRRRVPRRVEHDGTGDLDLNLPWRRVSVQSSRGPLDRDFEVGLRGALGDDDDALRGELHRDLDRDLVGLRRQVGQPFEGHRAEAADPFDRVLHLLPVRGVSSSRPTRRGSAVNGEPSVAVSGWIGRASSSANVRYSTLVMLALLRPAGGCLNQTEWAGCSPVLRSPSRTECTRLPPLGQPFGSPRRYCGTPARRVRRPGRRVREMRRGHTDQRAPLLEERRRPCTCGWPCLSTGPPDQCQGDEGFRVLVWASRLWSR